MIKFSIKYLVIETLREASEGFIDVYDLAKFLKVKKQTAYHFITTQDVPHYRVGRLLRFKLSEIEHWMRTNKVEKINLP
ncbi:MAG: helix-turn-helix domain-containing protein [Deltaproteobacteria bacterium]|nr:helix-turn-helix domain-containing protein [Deltaproteobacteria bacterium]MCK5709377.1 helix-turn-helix domain-containing protein [Deltaproteobacteria bacterium]